jgi:prepilin-type N-terminal cleavage/methylation domain-containing protein
MRKKYRHKGFTLLEILLTITLIGILATITLIAINPNRQLGQSRDLNRQKDIADI